MTPALARLIEDLLAPRPVWLVRATSEDGNAVQIASVPQGIAKDEHEAVAWFEDNRKLALFHPATIRAFPVVAK